MGNIFTHGLYDMQINMKKLLFLEEDEELDHVSAIDKATIRSVMTHDPVCLHQLVQVGDVMDVLKVCCVLSPPPSPDPPHPPSLCPPCTSVYRSNRPGCLYSPPL